MEKERKVVKSKKELFDILDHYWRSSIPAAVYIDDDIDNSMLGYRVINEISKETIIYLLLPIEGLKESFVTTEYESVIEYKLEIQKHKEAGHKIIDFDKSMEAKIGFACIDCAVKGFIHLSHFDEENENEELPRIS